MKKLFLATAVVLALGLASQLALAEEYNPCIGLSYEEEVACVHEHSVVNSASDSSETDSLASENEVAKTVDSLDSLSNNSSSAQIVPMLLTGVCDQNYSWIYNDSIEVSKTGGGDCWWSGPSIQVYGDVTVKNGTVLIMQYGTVAIYGRLIIESGAFVNIQTTSSSSETVTVRDSTTAYAAVVNGGLNLKAQNSGYNVYFYTGSGKQNHIAGTGYLHATTTTNSKVYFYGSGLNEWNGIWVDLGARIKLEGSANTNDPLIRIYNVSNSYPNIDYRSYNPNTSNSGILYIFGVRFDTGSYGVRVYQSNSSSINTTQPLSENIHIEYNKIGETNPIPIPIMFSQITVDKEINIQNNVISNFGKNATTQPGIYLSQTRNNANIRIEGNYLSDYNSSYSNYAIYLNDVKFGHDWALMIDSNQISGGQNGIKVLSTRSDSPSSFHDIEIWWNNVQAVSNGIWVEKNYDSDASQSNNRLIFLYQNKIVQSGTANGNKYGLVFKDLFYTSSDLSYTPNYAVQGDGELPSTYYYISGYDRNIYLDQGTQYLTILSMTLKYPNTTNDNSKLIYGNANGSGINHITIGDSVSGDGNWFDSPTNHGSAYQIYITGSIKSDISCSYNKFQPTKTISGIVCMNDL